MAIKLVVGLLAHSLGLIAEARACVEELEEKIRAEHPEVLDVSIHTEEQ